MSHMSYWSCWIMWIDIHRSEIWVSFMNVWIWFRFLPFFGAIPLLLNTNPAWLWCPVTPLRTQTSKGSPSIQRCETWAWKESLESLPAAKVCPSDQLVGGWATEKYESIGMMISNIWKNKSHVPNHQPDQEHRLLETVIRQLLDWVLRVICSKPWPKPAYWVQQPTENQVCTHSCAPWHW